MRKIVISFLILLTCLVKNYSQNLFIERNGICAIEAEFFSASNGAWEEVEGRNAFLPDSLRPGTYLLPKTISLQSKKPWFPESGQFGNAVMNASPKSPDFLLYAICIENAGIYQLHVLGQSSGIDILSSYNLEIIYPDNMTIMHESTFSVSEDMNWNRSDSLITLDSKGIYFLKITPGKEYAEEASLPSLYPASRIDKLVLTLENCDVILDEAGQIITHLPESYFNKTGNFGFLPDQIWQQKKSILIIEAEEIDHHESWSLKTSPNGYSGKGYLVWEGVSRVQSIEGLGGNDDVLYVRQGPQEEWLIVRCMIRKEGNYLVNARNIHQFKDGDNDAWVSLVGFRPYRSDAFDDRVRRMGDFHADGLGFTWLDWGVCTIPLKKGINNIYIGGRSVGWGIDRIVIYPEDNGKARQRALNMRSKPSVEYINVKRIRIR